MNFISEKPLEARMMITLRPENDLDKGFLYEVYASTRLEELAQVNWEPSQRQAFLQMQFRAQYSSYHSSYANPDYKIIMVDGTPAGRLYLDRSGGEIRIVDIALLPEYRDQGIGSSLLEEIIAESQDTGCPISIHVEHFNPALRLYERLGFNRVEVKGVYLFLKRQPEQESGQ